MFLICMTLKWLNIILDSVLEKSEEHTFYSGLVLLQSLNRLLFSSLFKNDKETKIQGSWGNLWTHGCELWGSRIYIYIYIERERERERERTRWKIRHLSAYVIVMINCKHLMR